MKKYKTTQTAMNSLLRRTNPESTMMTGFQSILRDNPGLIELIKKIQRQFTKEETKSD